MNKNIEKEMKENQKFLEELLEAPSPTGYENAAVDVFNNHMSEFSRHAFTDKFQNSVFTKGAINGTPILLSGHYDELGFLVSEVTESGMCKIVRISGEDRRVLPGSRLSALTKDGMVDGIIQYKAIHVQTGIEYDSIAKMEDLCLDFGCTDKKELEGLGIGVGTLLVYPKYEQNINFGPSGKFIVGNSLDDKLGVYIVAEILRRVDEDLLVKKNITLFGAGVAGEESGLRGAKVLARRVDPEISIDFDVCPSTEKDLGISSAMYGDISLGKGVVIEYGPAKSRRIGDTMKYLADKNNIPYQIGVGRAGGTNTSAIQEHATNCETMLLSLPNRNMHQPYEQCHWDDVESCINLVLKWIEEL